jgi:hypothetical protein
MIWLNLAATLLLGFFLLRNISADSAYKRHAKEGIFVFDDTRRSHQIFKTVFRVLLVLLIVYFFYVLFVDGMSFEIALGFAALMFGCVLFGFFPYSQARWVVLENGIFLYNYNYLIPWEDMIRVKPFGEKYSYLMVYLRASKADKLKKKQYPMMVLPGEKTVEMQNLIRDFIAVEDKRRHKRRMELHKASRTTDA